ncbi:MAG: hypothetical protein R3B40_15175 [Polyangiales bacterium]|nr:hypothetical protein [Sandaracinaceae bacterium]
MAAARDTNTSPRARTGLGQVARWYEERRDEIFGRRSPSLEVLRRSPAEYVVVALGTPRDVATAVRRVITVGSRWVRDDGIHARLARCHDQGWIPGVPTRAQLIFGGADMIRFLFEPGGRSLNRARGIDRRLYYVLLTLGDPATLLDPGGMTATRDEVVLHVLENFHFSPVYDLQLLATFEGGLAALAEACTQVLDGTHERATALRARIPEDDYFETLRRYALEASAGRRPAAPRFPCREGEISAPSGTPEELAALQRAAQTFTELWAFLAYCSALPTDPLELARRLHTLRACPVDAVPTLAAAPGRPPSDPRSERRPAPASTNRNPRKP